MAPDPGILDVLTRHAVPFVVVGGHAVNLHGYIRATEDTDVLWVRSPGYPTIGHEARQCAVSPAMRRQPGRLRWKWTCFQPPATRFQIRVSSQVVVSGWPAASSFCTSRT